MTVPILRSLVIALRIWVMALLTMTADPGSFLMVVLRSAVDEDGCAESGCVEIGCIASGCVESCRVALGAKIR